VRGQAYLELRDVARAAAEFKSILDSRGEVPSSMLYPLAHLGLARATADTDSDASRNAYESFLTLWTNADAGLVPLEAARAELSRLE
jgi:hypothetical protein